ncbi:alpha/beta hydrolase [Acidobacteria bacterium AB60]|nr:alpha/beta hydrolase [Acidobacteria bacterium AB60]
MPSLPGRQRGAAQSFSELLASDPEFADHDILLFQYPSKKFRPPSIPNIANQLLFAFDQCPYEQIILIAHSMGGLVAMEAILSALEKGKAAKVAGLLFYGVPMNGVEWAKYAQLAVGVAGLIYPHLNLFKRIFSGNRQVTALAQDSEFIELLTGRWAERALNGGNPDMAATERAAFPVRVVSGNDDWVVKGSSARGLYGRMDWKDVNQDHVHLVKPKDRSTEGYLIAKEFLKEARTWISPGSLLKLRAQIDRIWKMRKEETISNWIFDLEFDNAPAHRAGFPSPGKKFGQGLEGFSPFTVGRCEYTRRLPGTRLSFGFALGHLTANSLWNENFAFLHRTNFSALAPDLTGSLENRVRTVFADETPEEAWERIFENVELRVSDLETGTRFELEALAITDGTESLVREYTLPTEAQHLSGKEARIEVSFRSVMPSESCNYTVTFPWFCDGFTLGVSVRGQPRYLLYSSGMRGTAAIQSARQHQTKLACSSADLILPSSTLTFDWGF